MGLEDSQGVLQEQGLDLDLISAEEAATKSKDMTAQNKNLAKDQQRMLNENMNNTLVSSKSSLLFCR